MSKIKKEKVIKAWAIINLRRMEEKRNSNIKGFEYSPILGIFDIYKTKKLAEGHRCFRDDKVVPVEIKLLK